jgi:hypothetical protein
VREAAGSGEGVREAAGSGEGVREGAAGVVGWEEEVKGVVGLGKGAVEVVREGLAMGEVAAGSLVGVKGRFATHAFQLRLPTALLLVASCPGRLSGARCSPESAAAVAAAQLLSVRRGTM